MPFANKPSDGPAINGVQGMKRSSSPGLKEVFTSAQGVEAGHAPKIPNSITHSQLLTPPEAYKRWASTLADYIPITVAGSSSASIVINSNQMQKTAYEEKASKLRPSLLPVEAVVHGARAMEFGAAKYGVEQWRTADLQAVDFINALERHLIAYKQGEKCAPDSSVSHLGHIIANAAILLSRFEKERDEK